MGAIFLPLSFGWLVVVVAGISVGSQFAMLLALPPELIPKEAVGRASGMILSVGYLGGLFGPYVAGYILDSTGTLTVHLLIQSGLAAISATLVTKLRENRPRTGPE
jgi:cyanate permease